MADEFKEFDMGDRKRFHRVDLELDDGDIDVLRSLLAETIDQDVRVQEALAHENRLVLLRRLLAQCGIKD